MIGGPSLCGSIMAIRYSAAGRYPKSKAKKSYDVTTALITLVAITGGAGIGVFMAKGWTGFGVTALLATLAFLFLGMKWVDRIVEQMGKERVQYWRGGQVEELVSWLLEDLSDEWHIFNGLMLKDGADIDHVLVGPGGVFVISTKAQRGIFTAEDDRRIFCNLKPTGFINQVWDQTMQLKARISAFLVNDVPWVQAVLAVPFAWFQCENQRKDIWILHQENLFTTFQECERKLPKDEVHQLATLMKKLLIEGREFYKPPKAAQIPA